MARRYASLEEIENDHKITKASDYEFLHQLQSGLLLALKEQGRLSDMQYRTAQDRLDQQRRERTKKQQQGGEK